MPKRKNVSKRKNFLPTLVVTILLWILIGATIYFVDPQTIGIVPVFFLLLFFAFLFTFSTLLANTRRGVIVSAATEAFLILRYLGVGNLLNLLLLVGLAIAVELYFNRA